MRKRDLVPGMALARFSISITTLSVLTDKGLLSAKEAAAIHAVALAGLEQFSEYLDAGAISAARELITTNAKTMPIGHALASADTSKPN